MITQDEIKALLNYDPKTGLFTWLVEVGLGGRNGKIGDTAGCLIPAGYIVIRLKNRIYRAHVLAWLYMTGEYPKSKLDHRDTIRNNNIWENLREATNCQNSQNTNKRSDNTSGFKGVSLDKRVNMYRARIHIDKKEIHLGYFENPEDAHKAYVLAAETHFKDFARVA